MYVELSPTRGKMGGDNEKKHTLYPFTKKKSDAH